MVPENRALVILAQLLAPSLLSPKVQRRKVMCQERKKNEVWTCESFFRFSLCLTKDFLKSPFWENSHDLDHSRSREKDISQSSWQEKACRMSSLRLLETSRVCCCYCTMWQNEKYCLPFTMCDFHHCGLTWKCQKMCFGWLHDYLKD